MKKQIGTVLFCAGLAAAQTGSMAGPVAGYVFDAAAHKLRPVSGVPGAATVGAPIDAGYSLTAAYVAPRGDSFFGVDGGGAVHWFALSAGTAHETAIDGLMTSPERVAYSPSGTSAALYASGKAQIVSGLPNAPVLGTVTISFGVTSGPRGRGRTLSSLAVSDDGGYLLAAEGTSVQLASKNGVVRPVIKSGGGAVVAFAPGGHDAAIAALLIRDVPETASEQSLAADGPAFDSIAGIGFAADGSHAFVASASQQSVLSFDLAGNRTDLACPCKPAELTPMGPSFRLNELGGDPLWLVDGANARIVFVPALAASR